MHGFGVIVMCYLEKYPADLANCAEKKKLVKVQNSFRR